jgi:hypothetical protein
LLMFRDRYLLAAARAGQIKHRFRLVFQCDSLCLARK